MGTLLGYDDWWVVPCNKRYRGRGERGRPDTRSNVDPLTVAEGLGHAEMAQKYGVHFACVAGPCRPPPVDSATCDLYNNWAPIFLVTAVGASVPHDGFEFSSAEVASWKAGIRVCKTV